MEVVNLICVYQKKKLKKFWNIFRKLEVSLFIYIILNVDIKLGVTIKKRYVL